VNYAAILSAVGVLLALGTLGFYARRAVETLTYAVGGVGSIHEAVVALEHELHRANVLLEGSQGTNGVGTRLTEIEAKVQQAQLVVADAVEKVTSLSSRIQTRVSRAQRERGLLDDEGDDEPVSPQERREALAQLAAAGLAAPAEPARPAGQRRSGSGWDRVRRTAAAARKEA